MTRAFPSATTGRSPTALPSKAHRRATPMRRSPRLLGASSATLNDVDWARPPAVLDALAAHRDLDAANECSEFIRKNRPRMRYVYFHAHGLRTSSAVVEPGCKRAIGTRLKLGGMFWTANGANIIALRCTRLSGRFEEFREWRTARRTG